MMAILDPLTQTDLRFAIHDAEAGIDNLNDGARRLTYKTRPKAGLVLELVNYGKLRKTVLTLGD